ncbi:MAG: NADH-quinone oxidoreductase subunit NuoE [Myxococcota bacterium]
MQPETREQIQALMSRYPEPRGALLPAIHRVQAEQGWVSLSQAEELAELFELHPVDVQEVLSFYNMFYTAPQGRHHVYVCTNLPCSLRGGRSLLKMLEAHLGVRAGQTTRDGRITLGCEECLGSCGTAPVLRIGTTYHENLDAQRVRELVDGLE